MHKGIYELMATNFIRRCITLKLKIWINGRRIPWNLREKVATLYE
jgi:hypothetical protein